MKERIPLKNNIDCSGIEYCQKCSKKILNWTLSGNVFLAVLKLTGGSLAQSSGLMADGLQSIYCIIASLLIMYSINIAQKKKDNRYPYGYGKIEFIIALVVFSILVGLGLFISISNFIMILKKDIVMPGIIGLPVSVTSVFLTYMMFKYNTCAGDKLNSMGMIANGQQARADMYSSLAVTLGILLSQLSPNLAIFDRLAALFVGIIILKDAFEHWVNNLKVILDEVPEENYKKKINAIISKEIPNYKTNIIKFKRTGRQFWLGIGLNFPDDISVIQVEKITHKIAEKLKKDINWIGEVDFFLDR